MFLKTIFSFFKKKEKIEPDKEGFKNSGYRSISLWTAGLNFESRKDTVLRCHIHESVDLIREPDNEIDMNAIHVRRKDGSSLGYVGKYRAAKLAPLIDSNDIKPEAVIVDLKCDLQDEIFGVKIALLVKPKIFKKLIKNKEEIDFLFDTSDHGNLYLLLECEESTLDEIINLLTKNKININRTGISYRPGSNGEVYSWYLLLDKNIDIHFIEKVLRGNFPVLNEKYERDISEEYVELQEEEIIDLKTVNTQLIENVKKLQNSVDRSRKIHKLFSSQFQNIIKIALPNVIFIGGSIDILENEIEDYSNPLRKIIQINSDPQFKGKKITTLDKWWEIHFNTGQRDDGRLYFKKENMNLFVLISFKKDQRKDIIYLQKHI